MRKRLLQLLSIIAAGLVSALFGTFEARAAITEADSRESCSIDMLLDVEKKLSGGGPELTPDYGLSVSSDYLAACPGHYGEARILRRAMRFALDAGQPDLAFDYFERAAEVGVRFSRRERLDFIATLIAVGNHPQARALRDLEIVRWQDELKSAGLADVTETQLRDGRLLSVTFEASDPAYGQRKLWVAVPAGDGWPAAVVYAAEPARIALRQLVAGAAARTYEHLDLVHCGGRRVLAQSDRGLGNRDLDEAAHAAAKAYLAQPFQGRAKAPGEPVSTCRDPDRLFVSPDPSTAVPVWSSGTY
ncbi:MAG: hypothetical protein AAFQ84_01270 [Pseudomonadota bacterium]